MTPEQRQCEAFVELQRAATDGPWETCWIEHGGAVRHGITAFEKGDEFLVCEGTEEGSNMGHPPYIRDNKNMRMIAASRTVPVAELLAENAELREQLQAVADDETGW